MFRTLKCPSYLKALVVSGVEAAPVAMRRLLASPAVMAGLGSRGLLPRSSSSGFLFFALHQLNDLRELSARRLSVCEAHTRIVGLGAQVSLVVADGRFVVLHRLLTLQKSKHVTSLGTLLFIARE